MVKYRVSQKERAPTTERFFKKYWKFKKKKKKKNGPLLLDFFLGIKVTWYGTNSIFSKKDFISFKRIFTLLKSVIK